MGAGADAPKRSTPIWQRAQLIFSGFTPHNVATQLEVFQRLGGFSNSSRSVDQGLPKSSSSPGEKSTCLPLVVVYFSQPKVEPASTDTWPSGARRVSTFVISNTEKACTVSTCRLKTQLAILAWEGPNAICWTCKLQRSPWCSLAAHLAHNSCARAALFAWTQETQQGGSSLPAHCGKIPTMGGAADGSYSELLNKQRARRGVPGN